jgi:2-haloacid dehalogenase
MATGIGIDVYGTLVDPLGIADYLRPLVGDSAYRLAELWRAKQLEYTFRRAVMGLYANFDVCTKQALKFVLANNNVILPPAEHARILEGYRNLAAYPDAAFGLTQLKARGFKLVAFSNGVEHTLSELLDNAGLLRYLDEIISVDELKTFKPDPRVYAHLARRLNVAPNDTWLVSSNPFDLIGAKAAGLKGAWIRRNSSAVFDPWDIHPDLVASDLDELAKLINRDNLDF